MTSAQAAEIAEQIVRQATASTADRETRVSASSSYGEFRSKLASGRVSVASEPNLAFWRYLTAKPGVNLAGPGDPSWSPARFLIEPAEQRVLSKASSAAGGYLVPADFDSLITSARRARTVIGTVARVIETDHGRNVPLPTATAHGTGSWVAENAAVSASDDTFGQVTLGAYKGATKTIVSEELLDDAIEDFDAYLGGELGQRLALLEESAFAQGDGTGKPLGVVTSGNGVATVTAATGSATGFTLADVRSVWAALPEACKPDATWVMSPSAFASLANLTASGLLVLPSLHNKNPTLYSRPVFVSPELPAASANARSVVVGASRRATRCGGCAASACIVRRNSTRTRARSATACSRASTVASSCLTRSASSSTARRNAAASAPATAMALTARPPDAAAGVRRALGRPVHVRAH